MRALTLRERVGDGVELVVERLDVAGQRGDLLLLDVGDELLAVGQLQHKGGGRLLEVVVLDLQGRVWVRGLGFGRRSSARGRPTAHCYQYARASGGRC